MNNIECGQILLSLENSSTCKGKLLLNCLLCDERFHGFQDYMNHLLIEHYPQIELEDRNYRNVKEEMNYENTEEYVNDSANEFFKFLQMDTKSGAEDFADVYKLMDPSKCLDAEDSLIDVQTNNNIKKKKCTHCDRTFFLTYSLKHHLKEHRYPNGSKGGQYKCHICKTKFHLRFSLKQHIREHKINNLQAVNGERKIAPVTPKRKLNFAQNVTIKHNNISNVKKNAFKTTDSEEFQTMNVDSTSSSSATEHGNILTYQVGKNPALELEEFHCEVCNKKFQGVSRYNSHMQRHKPCEFKCETCHKEFKTAGELQTHTRFHTGERPYLCSSCGEKFATGSKLINHTRRHHTFERPKQCPICKKKFFGSGELKVHLQATHSNERNYKCTLCPSTFNRPFSLRTHMKSHENKREFKCDFCSASFNQKCNLTAHKKKTHCLLIDDDNRT